MDFITVVSSQTLVISRKHFSPHAVLNPYVHSFAYSLSMRMLGDRGFGFQVYELQNPPKGGASL
jgi:hypothetical protein